MSIASAAAAQQSAATQSMALTNAADASAAGLTAKSTGSASTSGSTAAGASTSQSALTKLSGNFQDFLQMLMTQLKNQDPSSPMDANTFTSELVQFSGVEQQINTNSSLTQLIQLTQSGEILQSSSMVGQKVEVAADHMPLQNGVGRVDFTAATAGPVALAVYNDAGTKLRDATVQAVAGQNTWNWNGTTNAGSSVADGSYRVAVMGIDASGNAKALPFDVVGTATGVKTSANNALTLQMGNQSVDFSAVKSILPAG